MSLKKNLGYNFLLSVSQLLFPLITIPYISRILNPEGVGKVAFLDSYTYFFTVVAEFGIVVYGIREISKVKNDKAAMSKLVSELLFIQVITSALSFFVYIGLMAVLWKKIEDFRLAAISVSFFLSYFLYCEWFFWATQQFRFIAIRSILIRVLGVVAVFWLIHSVNDYPYYYLIIAGTAILTLLVNFLRMFSELNLSFRNLNCKRHFPALLTNYGISLLYSVFIMLDTPLLRISNTAGAAGIYMIAIKIIRISSSVISDTLLVLYPHTVAMLSEQNEEGTRARIRQSSHFILLLSIPLSAGVFLLADDLTNVYLGGLFAEVAVLLKMLAVYPVLATYNLFLNKQVLMAHGKERKLFRSLFIGAFFFLLLNPFLSFYFAARGAAVALLISELVILAGNFYYSSKQVERLNWVDLKSVAGMVGGVLLFVPVLYLIRTLDLSALVRLIVSILLCVGVYFAWLLLVVRNQLVVATCKNFVSYFSVKSSS